MNSDYPAQVTAFPDAPPDPVYQSFDTAGYGSSYQTGSYGDGNNDSPNSGQDSAPDYGNDGGYAPDTSGQGSGPDGLDQGSAPDNGMSSTKLSVNPSDENSGNYWD